MGNDKIQLEFSRARGDGNSQGHKVPKIKVPEYILDMVAEGAKTYAADNTARWLGGFSEAQQKDVLQNSTHNLVETPERRELHRKILQEVAQGITGNMPDKSTLIYFSGPMAAGKSTLRQLFDNRIQNNTSNIPFADKNLEKAYKTYEQAQRRQMVSDFELYKERLPEFHDSGEEFAIIRPEASALDQAVIAWAKELKANIILEQLGDGVEKEWVQEKAQEHNLVAIGITADPKINAQRLHARNERTGEHISDEELARTITGFSSANNAFSRIVEHATLAILVKSDQPQYEVILAAKNGNIVDKDPERYNEFKSYAFMSDNDLLTAFQEEKSLNHKYDELGPP